VIILSAQESIQESLLLLKIILSINYRVSLKRYYYRSHSFLDMDAYIDMIKNINVYKTTDEQKLLKS